MNKFLFKTLRLIDLLIAVSTPSLVMYFLSNQGFAPNFLFLLIGFYLVLMLWGMFFVILEHEKYPAKLSGALAYTGSTLLTIIIFILSSSFFLSFYLYFMSTLISLAVLLLLGSIYILKSVKKIAYQKWFGALVFVLSIFISWYAYSIANPLIGHIVNLSSLEFWIFFPLFFVQIMKMVIHQASYMTSHDKKTAAIYPLPKIVVLAAFLIGILMSGIVVVF